MDTWSVISTSIAVAAVIATVHFYQLSNQWQRVANDWENASNRWESIANGWREETEKLRRSGH